MSSNGWCRQTRRHSHPPPDLLSCLYAYAAVCWPQVGSVNSGKAALNNDMRIMDTTDVDCQLRDQSSCSDDASVNISSQSHPDLTVDCEVGSGQMRCFEDDNGGGEASDAALSCTHLAVASSGHAQ